MKPTTEILERIRKSSADHKDGVFTRLYRYLLRDDVYRMAYKNLYANQGAATKGTDNDTADSFSQEYIDTISILFSSSKKLFIRTFILLLYHLSTCFSRGF